MRLAIVLLSFLIASSCNQNKKLEEDLGPQVSSDQFEKVLIEAWGGDDIFSIKKDDYAYVAKEISINGGAMDKTVGKAMTITQVEEVDGVVKNHLVINSEEIQQGQQAKLSSRERILSVKKSASTSTLSQSNVEDEIQTTPFEGFLDVLTICRNKVVECFKLKSENFTERVPPEMEAKSCRFFPNCQWSGKKVSFVIRVSFREDGSSEIKKQNNIITLKIVHDMPYLFKMVSYCFEGLSEHKGQKFPVNICTQVKDSIRGQ